MTNILTLVRKTPGFNTWYGMIHIYDDDMYLYQVASKIQRLNEADAMVDAENMKKDILERNAK